MVETKPKLRYLDLDPKVVYISAMALRVLISQVHNNRNHVEEKKEAAHLESGDEWIKHNEALRDAIDDWQLAKAVLQSLEFDLGSAEILEPSQQTEFVDIGNTVVLKFIDEEEEEEETYTILGKHDREADRSFISHRTPLAQALFGHKVGDIVTYKVEGVGEILVQIIKILPGQFWT